MADKKQIKKCYPTFHVFKGKGKTCQCGKCVWDEKNNRPQYVKQSAPKGTDDER